jgi:DNA-binding response OmpR family regulator
MDVALVYWPAEAARLERLRACRQPRLVIVEHGDPPPTADPLEDWVRSSAHEDDVNARVAVLRARSVRRGHGISVDNGVMQCGDQLVILPPIEARLASTLLQHVNAVVTREALVRAGWPDRDLKCSQVLDTHVGRLRRLVAGTAIRICTVHQRGYLLQLLAGQPGTE